jgi:ABC-2 type transport system permease protein
VSKRKSRRRKRPNSSASEAPKPETDLAPSAAAATVLLGDAVAESAPVAAASPAVSRRPKRARAVARDAAAPRTKPQPQPLAEVVHDLVWQTGFLNVAAIARHEAAALFVSPSGWLVAIGFTFFVSAFGFVGPVLIDQQGSLDGAFRFVAAVITPVAIPVLTMGVFSQERRAGTLELLLTSPVRHWELALGKWLGVFAVYLLLLATTLVYVALLMIYIPDKATVSVGGLTVQVGNLDAGLVTAMYAGLVLAGAAATAVGTLASMLTRSRAAAFFLALVFLLVLWYAGYVLAFATLPPVSLVFDYIGGFNRLQAFSLGMATLKDVAYFLTLAVGALFVTARLQESRRWR